MENKDQDKEIINPEVIEQNDDMSSIINDKAEGSSKVNTTDEDGSFKATYDKAAAAVALSYHEGDESPFVSALGYESRAQAIIDMAKELGIYVHKDPALFDQLKNLKEGANVPPELFEIISTILAFSYYLQGKTPASYTRKDGSKAINTEA